MPKLILLSRRAAEYEHLIRAAQLPDLEFTLDPAEAELAFGEPNLIRAALPELRALRWAQANWAGVETLLAPGLRRDYQLTNARTVFGPPMVEYVFGYLLAHERRILARYAAQQAGQWDHTPPGALRGKRLGLLGVGSIGAELARMARHFGLRVSGCTRASAGCPAVDRYYHAADWPTFAADLDYLVNSLPDTPGTRGLLNAERLAGLPPRALFINVGRGSVLEEAALIQALQAGQLAGAVLDVFPTEPLPPEHPFWRTPNLLVTSHTAALSYPEDIAGLFIDNYRRLRRGEALWHLVDFERGY